MSGFGGSKFDPNAPNLFEECERCGFFDAGAKVTRMHLQAKGLEEALKEKGSEKEWKSICANNDFCMIDKLISLVLVGSDTELRCLAYAGVIYNSLWTDFTALNKSNLRKVYQTIDSTLNAVHELLGVYEEMKSKYSSNKGPYAGFDERDIKEYNMDGWEEFQGDKYTGSAEVQALAEELKDAEHVLMVLLLLLSQIFGHCASLKDHLGRNSLLCDPNLSLLKNVLVPTEGEGEEEATENSTGASVLIYSGDCPPFLPLLERLIVSSDSLPEGAYELLLTLLARLDGLFPEIELGVGDRSTTSLAAICAAMQGVGTASVNLGEGMLHNINTSGYPNMDEDMMTTLSFILHLINASPFGYFTLNNVKVLVDIILREVRNLPSTDDYITAISKYFQILAAIGRADKREPSGIREYRMDEVLALTIDFSRRDSVVADHASLANVALM